MNGIKYGRVYGWKVEWAGEDSNVNVLTIIKETHCVAFLLLHCLLMHMSVQIVPIRGRHANIGD